MTTLCDTLSNWSCFHGPLVQNFFRPKLLISIHFIVAITAIVQNNKIWNRNGHGWKNPPNSPQKFTGIFLDCVKNSGGFLTKVVSGFDQGIKVNRSKVFSLKCDSVACPFPLSQSCENNPCAAISPDFFGILQDTRSYKKSARMFVRNAQNIIVNNAIVWFGWWRGMSAQDWATRRAGSKRMLFTAIC